MKVDVKRKYTNNKGETHSYIWLISQDQRIPLGILKQNLNASRQNQIKLNQKFKIKASSILTKIQLNHPELMPQETVKNIWHKLNQKFSNLLFTSEKNGQILSYHSIWQKYLNPEARIISNNRWYASHRKKTLKNLRNADKSKKKIKKKLWILKRMDSRSNQFYSLFDKILSFDSWRKRHTGIIKYPPFGKLTPFLTRKRPTTEK